ncbi:MAG: polymer-forming cytoskeletal protein [Huintestinicola sp.]
MSLKDNFNQAVKEILRKEGMVGEDLSKESKKKSELDRYLDPPRAAAVPENINAAEESVAPAAEPEPVSAPESPYIKPEQSALQFGNQPKTPQNSGSEVSEGVAPAAQQAVTPFSQYAQTARQGLNSQSQGNGNPPPPPPRTPSAAPSFSGGNPNTPYYETEETTVISRNTIIDGNIRSFANINIDGSVKGDVKITKNINVTGKVVGDIECNNSIMTGASMQGNVASKGQVQIDRDSMLLGDITAQYLDLNGKVKGNIDVGGKAEFKTDAVILGNITASTITVLDGATIQGYVNTTFLQESSSSIFPEAIALNTD